MHSLPQRQEDPAVRRHTWTRSLDPQSALSSTRSESSMAPLSPRGYGRCARQILLRIHAKVVSMRWDHERRRFVFSLMRGEIPQVGGPQFRSAAFSCATRFHGVKQNRAYSDVSSSQGALSYTFNSVFLFGCITGLSSPFAVRMASENEVGE